MIYQDNPLNYDEVDAILYDDCGFVVPGKYLYGYKNAGEFREREGTIMKGCNITSFYYDIDENILFDEDGLPIFNYWMLGITPAMYHLFLQSKEYHIFEIKPFQFVELIYPEDDEEYYEIIRTPIKSSS